MLVMCVWIVFIEVCECISARLFGCVYVCVSVCVLLFCVCMFCVCIVCEYVYLFVCGCVLVGVC
jgi:hypothetical protein